MEFHTATDLTLALAFAGVALGLGFLAVWLAWREASLGRAMVLMIRDRDSYRARVDQLIGLNRQYQAEIDRKTVMINAFDHDGDGKVGGSKAAKYSANLSKAKAGK